MLKRSSIVKTISENFWAHAKPLCIFLYRSGFVRKLSEAVKHKNSGKNNTTRNMPVTVERVLPRIPEARPKIIHLWREPEKPDPFLILQQRFADWIKFAGGSENLFKQHVYDNPRMNWFDLRQHRVLLYQLLYEGEDMAVDFISFKKSADDSKQNEIDNFVVLIDQKVNELRKTLHEWHGDLDHQGDIPQSFKDAIHEFERGELEPFDDILEEEPV